MDSEEHIERIYEYLRDLDKRLRELRDRVASLESRYKLGVKYG